MPISNLSFNNVLFMIELLSALYVFTSFCAKKSRPGIRYPICILVCLTASVFFPIVKDVSYSWWYISLMYIVFALLALASLFVILKVSYKEIFFFLIVSYSAQHFAYQLDTIIAIATGLSSSYQSAYNGENFLENGGLIILRLVLTVVVFSLVYVTLYLFYISKITKRGLSLEHYQIVIISSIVLIIDIVVNAVIVAFGQELNKIIEYMICIYSLVNCFIILFLLNYVLQSKNLKNDLYISSILLKESEEKYNQMKTNVDLINIKCHDMKQQIIAIGQNKAINQEALNDMTDAIQIYDSNMRTGNDAVDIILVNKKLQCNQQDVNLKVFAECSGLGFISDSDIYSLFGNIIDNAIEAVSKIEDKEKRLVNLFVRNTNGFISIRVENYYTGPILFRQDGKPKTTKSNDGFHGYGISSVEMIVNKYHGNYVINTENNVFTISIFFPIAQATD